MKFKKIVCLLAAAAMVTGLTACNKETPAPAQTEAPKAETEAAAPAETVAADAAEGDSYEIRVAHVCGVGSPYDYGAVAFKNLVEQRTGGRVTVTVHAGDMSTDEVEVAEMLQNNNLEIGWIGTGALGGYVSELGIFELPFLFESEEHVNAALEGDFGQSMLAKLSAVDGITGLGFHEDGWRNILTNNKTINSVEDMEGVRMRSMQNEVCIAMYNALGSTPVALSSGEQFTGIQNGVVDGTDNSALYAVADGYIEVVNNICDIHHFYSSGIIVASSKWYDALSAEDQALIAECAQEAGEAQRGWFLENDEALIAEYEAKGYTVTRPTDIDAWKEKTASVYTEMYKIHPEWEEMVNLIKAAAK